MRSLVSGIAATGLDNLPRLSGAEISKGLLHASSLDALASIFERLAYKALYCALVVETMQRNKDTYRAIAWQRLQKADSLDGVLQSALTVLLAKGADPDPSKDLDHEFQRLVYNEANRRARRQWSRPPSVALDDVTPGTDALRVEPMQESTLTTEDTLAKLPTDEHRRVLELWAGGFSEAEIARELGISVRTVERRKGEIRRLLGPELLP